MKRIQLLATGGTIASVPSKDGYSPGMSGEELLACLGDFCGDCILSARDILSLDSSNIQPEEWAYIAAEVYASLSEYDGVVITHGTDTLAYTASILSFMLRGLDKTVVLTGSQLPMNHPLTDAKTNLISAILTAQTGIPGVYVVFNRKIINGARAVKVRSTGFDAFESINAPLSGFISTGGVVLNNPQPVSGIKSLENDLVSDVFLLKAIPGTKPELFDALLNLHYRGVVVEAFGVGGLHYLRRNLAEKLNLLAENGIPVVVTSQCLYDFADLSIYEVGRKFNREGVINGWDMTGEAAVTKLMWALARTKSIDELHRLMLNPLCGEISVPIR
ncbi:MAG: asparaginase [Christensenellales bacterium]|jgi:L-asparaginase